jgi:hypothetical protein
MVGFKQLNWIFLITVFSGIKMFGQDLDITFKVTNYSIDGVSLDEEALQGDIALHFYACSDESICFSNHWRNSNSQSYGKVYALKKSDFPETESEHRYSVLKFTWDFENSYDDVSGQAAVTLTTIYIGNTIKFTAEILVLDTNSLLSMKGYVE